MSLERFFAFIVSIFLLCCCAKGTRIKGNAMNDTIHYRNLNASELGIQPNSSYIISSELNLEGKNLVLPNSVTLDFQGGHICNGKVTGNNTKIENSNGNVIFNKVRIDGTWIVPNIRTSMFDDLEQTNSLRNVFALASPSVSNTIYIEKGDYFLTAIKNKDVCLAVCSNTTLIIDGNIRLSANNYPRYDILRVKGENIVITGKGSIVGDKKEHTGTEGEWGMGIRFHQAVNSSVSGLTIKNCWGDCIYVGGNSKNVTIEGCTIDGGRRQGISITKADCVTVRKCEISNVSGTKPEYAIDIEPNQGDTVNHVMIENVKIQDCKGGILSTKGNKDGRGKDSYIGSVVVRDCKISTNEKYPIRLRRCENATVERCHIYSTNDNPSIFVSEINDVVVRDNIINLDKKIMASVKNIAKEVIGKNEYKSINASKNIKKEIYKNRVFYY